MQLNVSTSVYMRLTATNLFSNYVRLWPGVPKRLHFTDDYYVERDILNKEDGKLKRISGQVLYVNEEDGQEVSKTFSILSQKLLAHIEPFIKNKQYNSYDFIITEMGEGFYKDWNVQVIKRPEGT